eukprot:m.237678 g.237678  ORF g.237678 m.237678 type:complete len:319 (+) comp21272_c0_seq1:50-1006(+)
MFWWILGGLSALIAISFIRERLRPKIDFTGKHVFITGGSTGLGLALATKFYLLGAKVTIVSRSEKNLAAAREAIAARGEGMKVVSVACDVMDADAVNKAVTFAAEVQGRAVDVLICSAGLAEPGRFLEIDLAQHRRQMDLNYFGTLHAIRAVLPAMCAATVQTHVVLVSSAVALCSMSGYSAYAPTKFALRGLADALRNELAANRVAVTIFYPSNINTPGFEAENKTKPAETTAIEGTGSLLTPEDCAQHLIDGMHLGRYAITNELLTEAARMGVNGSTPRPHVLLEALLAPLTVIMGWAFTWYMDWTVRSHNKQKKQ